MPLLDGFENDELVTKTAWYVESFMSQFDASHDWQHILRVAKLARIIFRDETKIVLENFGCIMNKTPGEHLSLRKIILASLLHDVTDRKYITNQEKGNEPQPIIAKLLKSFGADEQLANDVEAICNGVSFHTETKDTAAALRLLQRYPELGIVQDADRLDAIGAIGIGRVFTYGGAKTSRSLHESMQHFDEKLLHLGGIMKTFAGARMARERTERLEVFKAWWRDECSVQTSW